MGESTDENLLKSQNIFCDFTVSLRYTVSRLSLKYLDCFCTSKFRV